MKENIATKFTNSVFLVTYLLSSRIWKYCFKVTSKLDNGLINIKSDRYIIVANHQKAIDPYVIFATLPIKTLITLLPLRTLVANIYLKKWWQRLFMLSFGSFPAKSEKGKQSGIKGGLYFSDKGASLLIFPEGKRNKLKSKLKIKLGVAHLALSRNFTFLPVFIDYKDKSTLVHWGKPFKINRNQKKQSPEKLAKVIFAKVLKLSTKKYIYEK